MQTVLQDAVFEEMDIRSCRHECPLCLETRKSPGTVQVDTRAPGPCFSFPSHRAAFILSRQTKICWSNKVIDWSHIWLT